MGVFDNIRCEYPLPDGRPVPFDAQTKDTPAQWLNNYKIDQDGFLWHEDHDIEDQSDPNATGLERIVGMCTPVNQRWVKEKLTGEISFYDDAEYSAYFVDGFLKEIHLIEGKP